MKIIVFHQPFPMGNYKVNEIIANHLSKKHEVYLLQQLNGATPDIDYVTQIKELNPDLIYFEMLDKETFNIVESLDCEKILLQASNGILTNYEDIFDYHGKWYTKVLTNSKYMYDKFNKKGITTEYFKYLPSVLNDSDLVFDEKYNHDSVFLGMGFQRMSSESYRKDREIFFSNFDGIDFKIYGNGWPNFPHCGGVLPADDIGKLYYSAKSAFGLIGETQRTHGQINNRYTEMAYAEVPIITQNYETIDWFGAENYLNFVESREEAQQTINNILNNPDVYKSKSKKLKKFIVKKHNEFMDKLSHLMGD